MKAGSSIEKDKKESGQQPRARLTALVLSIITNGKLPMATERVHAPNQVPRSTVESKNAISRQFAA